MESPIFVGLDLAWSDRNRTGAAILRDGTLLDVTGELIDDASIEGWLAQHLPPSASAVIGIDAPLRVPNEHGRRRADHEVSLEWGRFGAGAYPANRRLLAHTHPVRGEALVERLNRCFGFVECAPIPHLGEGRYICEVFPHPAHVALFALPRILQYKRKSGRTPATIAAEFVRYQQLLSTLEDADPPLRGLGPLLTIDAGQLRGRRLQALEEMLDAVTCAYVVWFAWYRGPRYQRIYGSVAEGHILVPSLEPVS